MHTAVGISVQRSNSLMRHMDTRNRMGPDMRVKGDTMRSHISTACILELPHVCYSCYNTVPLSYLDACVHDYVFMKRNPGSDGFLWVQEC